ncbi:MAG: carboxypeptidase-like regulatory domain-containing protein, partial [Gemmatimonadales bacterium]
MRRGSWAGLPRRRVARWPSIAASALAHVLLVLLGLDLSRRETDALWRRIDEERERRAPVVTPLYVPLPPPPAPTPPPPPEPEPEQPPPPPEPPPPPREAALPPPARNPEPEPDANAPSDAERTRGEERPEDDPGERRNAAPDAGAPERAEISTAPTIETEARRIFGRRRPRTPPGAGPRASRPMESYAPERPDKCVPQERDPGDSARTPQFGVVTGRIYRGDNGRPLAGAHLQMVGAPFTAFTDDNGDYQFRFDLSLMD